MEKRSGFGGMVNNRFWEGLENGIVVIAHLGAKVHEIFAHILCANK